jgi:hypothetical protein
LPASCPDAIPLEHRPFLLVERNEHGERQPIDDAELVSANEREPIKPGLLRCADIRTDKWPRVAGRNRFAESHPVVLE